MQFGSMALIVFAIFCWTLLRLVRPEWSFEQSLIILGVVTVLFGVAFHPYAQLLWEGVDWIIDASGGNDRGRNDP
jgi:hypothetical protein